MSSTQELLHARRLGKGESAQEYVDSEVLRRCAPYVPMDTGALIRSGIDSTRIGSGEVRYRAPYARKWYYTKAHFSGGRLRGDHWFTRMLNDGGKRAILRGTARITGGEWKE